MLYALSDSAESLICNQMNHSLYSGPAPGDKFSIGYPGSRNRHSITSSFFFSYSKSQTEIT